MSSGHWSRTSTSSITRRLARCSLATWTRPSPRTCSATPSPSSDTSWSVSASRHTYWCICLLTADSELLFLWIFLAYVLFCFFSCHVVYCWAHWLLVSCCSVPHIVTLRRVRGLLIDFVRYKTFNAWQPRSCCGVAMMPLSLCSADKNILAITFADF